MCKLSGKLWTFLTAVLPVVIFFSVVSIPECHAQNYFCTISQPVITSVTPSTWVAGQTINVKILGTNFYEPGYYQCQSGYATVTDSTELVQFSQVNTVSPQEYDVVVTVPSTVPTESACVIAGWQIPGPEVVRAGARVQADASSSTTCVSDPSLNYATYPVQICGTPTVTSISSNVWIAGETYNNVTITGTNFTTNDAATASCPATTATITTPSGAAVALGAVTVNSSTQITIASVTPPANEITEGATVAVSGEASPQPNADVLEIPSIT